MKKNLSKYIHLWVPDFHIQYIDWKSHAHGMKWMSMGCGTWPLRAEFISIYFSNNLIMFPYTITPRYTFCHLLLDVIGRHCCDWLEPMRKQVYFCSYTSCQRWPRHQELVIFKFLDARLNILDCCAIQEPEINLLLEAAFWKPTHFPMWLSPFATLWPLQLHKQPLY